jgi:RNA polymerase sigma factor (sigma-70 family)
VAKHRSLNDDELNRLSDERLLEQIAKARSAGDLDATKRALAILVFRHYDNVERRVRIKVRAANAEDVAMEIVVSAIRSSLSGRTIGEFRAWLNRIVKRRIADYHRRPGVEMAPLPEEHDDDEEIWGRELAVGDPTGEVDVQSVIDQALASLGDSHRTVVELYVFEDLNAAETAAKVNAATPGLDPPMTENNVQQIASRFRAELRRLLEDSDNPASPGRATEP